MNTIKFFAINFLFAITLTSCSGEENPTSTSEKKVITTMIINFSNYNGDPTGLTLTYRDLDGDGPNPPVVTVVGKLRSTIHTAGSILLLNENEDPAINISEQVLAEAESHQFNIDFVPTTITSQSHPVSLVEFTNLSLDSNENPLISEFLIKPEFVGTGTFTVKLRSQIDKTLAHAGMVNEGGQVEIEATFEIPVEECVGCFTIF